MIAAGYHDKVNVLQNAGLASAGPFDRAEWFGLLANAQDAVFATAQQGDAMIALPLVKRNNRLESLINWYSFAWRPLASSGADMRPLATALARGLKAEARRVTLWPLPDEDGSASMLEASFRDAGWWVSRDTCDNNHVLHVNGRSYAEYLAGRPGQLRTTLKRKAKKVQVEILQHFEPDAWQSYNEIYANSWKPAEGDSALLRAFAEREGAAGRIRLALARHEGRPVAAQFWTVEAGTAWIHKLAHLEEAQPLSAGTTLTAALFEHVIDNDKVDLVDFGTGDDPYKRDWMEEIRLRYRLDCHNIAHPLSWPHIMRGAVQRLASFSPAR